MEASLVSAVLKSLASSLLPKLLAAHQGEFGRDIKLLQEELEVLRQFIQSYEVKSLDIETQEWLRRLKGVAYDLEDCIDSFINESDLEFNRGFKGLMAKHMSLLNRSRIAREIQDLKGRLLVLRQQRERLPGAPASSASVVLGSNSVDGSTSVDPRIHAVHAHAPRLFGVDAQLDELVKLLTDNKSPESAARLKVVSIVGYGGIGKTTLANQVYRTIRPQFNCGAWLTLSQKPDIRSILSNLLRQVQIRDTIKDEAKRDERDLINEIRESLQNRRYLLVLDDIWSLEVWEIIKLALPMDTSCSRIITTTRIQSVAISCCSHWNDIVYEIRPLSTYDSRRLFDARVFGSEDSCPPHLVQVSDKILKKCSGLPLAIITMASLLATREHAEEQWLEMDNYIGKPLAESTTFENMRHTLYLCYTELPYYLRACLLYLSIFPEDHVITRDRLVLRWIAEGLIVDPGRNLKELGESYFNELINRSMIQPVHFGYDGQPEDCAVHTLMHDFIVSVSAEENFALCLGDPEPAAISHNRIRHLALNNISEKHNVLDLVGQSQHHIRSLTIYGSLGSICSLKNFRILRVLDLEDCQNLENQHFKGIGNLLHLRYLNIRNTPISKIPDQIMKLKLLQTLDLRGTGVQDLQENVVQLHNLAFLLCDKLRLPKGIGRMKTLCSMSSFDILRNNIAIVEELGNLFNLRELVLWWSPDLESNNTERYKCIAFSLYKLSELKSLSIHGIDSSVDLLDHLYHPIEGLKEFQMNKDCYLSRIPKWFRTLPNLANVCIDVNKVNNEDLKLLSSLRSLMHLSLSSRVVPTEKLVISNEGFSALREFHLHSAWANLKFEPESITKIERLFLAFHVLTTKNYGFSVSVESLKYLKKFDIRINTEGANASQIKAVEDAINKAADSHPNSPIINIQRLENSVDNEGRDEAKNQVHLKHDDETGGGMEHSVGGSAISQPVRLAASWTLA